MNKNLFKIFTVSALLMGLSNSSVFAVDYFQAGIRAYRSNNLSEASNYFKNAVKTHPQNNTYRYWYAQALMREEKCKEAQLQYQKIIQNNPYSPEAVKSSKGIVLIQQYYEAEKSDNYSSSVNSEENLKNKLKASTINGIGENYIFNATANGQVMRWNSKKMPVAIYIDTSSKAHYNVIKEVIDSWVSSTGGNLSYRVVPSETNANIVVNFMNKVDNSTAASQYEGYASGFTIPTYKGSILKNAKVELALKDMTGKLFAVDDFYNTALHEFGHAFGIYGHSDNDKDIMYPVNKTGGKKRATLSERDKNTMKLLYRLDPDISNFDNPKVQNSKVNDLILGDKKFRLEQKLKEAQEYVKKVPRHPMSWSSLGDAYKELGKYSEAELNYNKALNFDANYEEAIYGLATVYEKTGNNAKAINQYNKLISINPKEVKYAYACAVLYKEKGNKQEALNVINNLIKNNSDAKNNSNIKSLILELSLKK